MIGNSTRWHLAAWLAVGMLVAGTGCPEESDDDTTGNPDDDDTDEPGLFETEAIVNEVIPTVVTVQWSADLPEMDSAFVEWGLDESYGRQIPVDVAVDAPYEAMLMGQKPSMEYHYRVVVTVGDDLFESLDDTFTTGPSPTDLPELTVEVFDSEAIADGFMLTSIISSPTAAVILDRDGEYVWWSFYDEEGASITRARPSLDGTAMLSLVHAESGEWHPIEQVPLDGSGSTTLPPNSGHHDFLQIDENTLTSIAFDPREVDGEQVVGDRLVEMDTDGNVHEVWTVWDHAEYDPEIEYEQGTGWSHANALRYVPGEDAYYLSLRNLNAIWKIDRDTGDVLSRIGGDDSDYILINISADNLYQEQHGFQVLDDGGLLVFDNQTSHEMMSRAVEYTRDDEAMEIERQWFYTADPALYCFGLGDVHRFASGNTLITWSSAGQIDEVSPEGELLWQLSAGIGHGIGYMTWVDDLSDLP